MKFLNSFLLLIVFFLFSNCSTIDTAVEEESYIEILHAPSDSISYFIGGVHYTYVEKGSSGTGNSAIYSKVDPDYYHPDSVAIFMRRAMFSDISYTEFGLTEKFHKESSLLNKDATSFFFPENMLVLLRKDEYDFSREFYRLHDDDGVFFSHRTNEETPKTFYSYDTSNRYGLPSLPQDIHKDSFFKLIRQTNFDTFVTVEFEFEASLFPYYYGPDYFNPDAPDYPSETIRMEKGYLRLTFGK